MRSFKIGKQEVVRVSGIEVYKVVTKSKNGEFEIFVCWRQIGYANGEYFHFSKSKGTYRKITESAVMESALSGIDIGGTIEQRSQFPELPFMERPMKTNVQTGLF